MSILLMRCNMFTSEFISSLAVTRTPAKSGHQVVLQDINVKEIIGTSFLCRSNSFEKVLQEKDYSYSKALESPSLQ